MFDQSLSVFETKLGEQNPNCGIVLYNKSELHLRKKDYFNSRELLRKSMEIFTNTYGGKHKLIADNYLALAELDKKEKNYINSLKNYSAARDMYLNVFGKDYYILPTLEDEILELSKKIKLK